MKRKLLILSILFIAVACGTSKNTTTTTNTSNSSGQLDYGSPKIKQQLKDKYTFEISIYSKDDTYGFTQENPIMVGGGSEGPMNERRFLNALTGPKGENLKYERLGSCCHFKTKNGMFGDTGLLDIYSVSYQGIKRDVKLYINMYDSDTLKVPVGFELKK